jgi:hypothetical protein
VQGKITLTRIILKTQLFSIFFSLVISDSGALFTAFCPTPTSVGELVFGNGSGNPITAILEQ